MRTWVFNSSLTHTVLKKARKFLVSPILLFATLVVPALTNASPEDLAKAKNCFSCHKVEARRIGPPYIDVADKYSQDKDARTKLIRQIQDGGVEQSEKIDLPPQPIVATLSGFPTASQWHNVIMPPQPQVNAQEAKQLADWILSLSKKKATGSSLAFYPKKSRGPSFTNDAPRSLAYPIALSQDIQYASMHIFGASVKYLKQEKSNNSLIHKSINCWHC